MLPLERPISKRHPMFAVPDWLKQKAIRRLAEVVRLAESKLNRRVFMPSISFDLGGATAGKAYWKLNHVQLNGVLLAENQQEFLQETIPQEFAHLLTRLLYPRASPRGKEWSYIMRDVLGVSPSECRTMDVTRAASRSKPYIYSCGCADRTHALPEDRHLRIQRWGERVLCRKCHKVLQFVRKQYDLPERLKPTSAQVAYVTLLAEKLSRQVPPAALGNKFVCKTTIEAFKAELDEISARPAQSNPLPAQPALDCGGAAPAASALAATPGTLEATPPSDPPASEKQRAFAEKLAKEHAVPLFEGLFQSKKATSAWIEERLRARRNQA